LIALLPEERFRWGNGLPLWGERGDPEEGGHSVHRGEVREKGREAGSTQTGEHERKWGGTKIFSEGNRGQKKKWVVAGGSIVDRHG